MVDILSKNKFIESVAEGAISGWHKHGVLPSISLSQAILESAWGTSELAVEANNLFGIKGDYKGKSYVVNTSEYIDGKWLRVDASFKEYPDWNHSVEDHGEFFVSTPWRKNNYKKVVGEEDYKKAAGALQDSGYATDPKYADKLIGIIEQYGLYKYDDMALNPEKDTLFSLEGRNYRIDRVSEDDK